MNGCDGAYVHSYNKFASENNDGLLPHEYTVPYINSRASCASSTPYNVGAQVLGANVTLHKC